MGYYYNAGDRDSSVRDGASGITFSRVIQNPDAYGNYNVAFTSDGDGHYHVHFFAGGTRVNIIRYFGSGGGEGTNIIKHGSGDKKTLRDLAHECSDYTNHVAMLNNFKSAISGVSRNQRNELE